jgi:hypothetical protein
MSDDPSDNHDGNTQPLPNVGPGAPTQPLAADAIGTEPVAQAPMVVAGRSSLSRWLPALVTGLVIIAGLLLAAMILPQLIAPPLIPTPTPTITLPTPTSTEETQKPPSEEPAPEPEPTVSVPIPTVEPPLPTPTPTG